MKPEQTLTTQQRKEIEIRKKSRKNAEHFVDFTASLHSTHTHTPATILASCVTLCKSKVVVKHEQRAHIIFYLNRIPCHRLLCIQCALNCTSQMLEMVFPKKISNKCELDVYFPVFEFYYIWKKIWHSQKAHPRRQPENRGEKPKEKKNYKNLLKHFPSLFAGSEVWEHMMT